jgi:hypothetical protein
MLCPTTTWNYILFPRPAGHHHPILSLGVADQHQAGLGGRRNGHNCSQPCGHSCDRVQLAFHVTACR